MFFNKKEEIDEIEYKIINDIRALNIDIINNHKNKYNIELSLNIIPLLYTLYGKHLIFNPNDFKWVNRDRVILSSYTSLSALLSVLLMSSDKISLDNLKENDLSFFQNYIDVLTDNFIDGSPIATGIAHGEKYLNSLFKNNNFINFNTYLIMSAVDLISGNNYETLSYISKNKLNKLIIIYDNYNNSFGEKNELNIDPIKYFESFNFNIYTTNSNDIISIDDCLTKAKESNKTSVIILNQEDKNFKYENNYYQSNYELSSEEISKIKNALEVRDIPFTVSSDTVEAFRNMVNERVTDRITSWNKIYSNLDESERILIDKVINNDLIIPSNTIEYSFDSNDTLNIISNKILDSIKKNCQTFYGNINEYQFRNNVLGIQNGLSLVGLRNYSITSLKEANLIIPSIKYAIKNKLPNIYIFTEESDTYFNISNLRNIENLEIYRPNDANEMIGIYKIILSKNDSPCCIVVSNSITKGKDVTSINDVKKGAYIVKKEEKNISSILISSGKDLDIALNISNTLSEKGYDIRVVSMPSIEVFKKNKKEYQDELLPLGNKVFVIDSSTSYPWYQFVYNDKYLITPDKVNWYNDSDDLNLFKEKVIEKIENLLI